MDKSIDEIFMVYNADSGVWGDVKYVMKKLARRDKCGLCEITHTYKEKPDWKACRRTFDVPITVIYRDQITSSMAEVMQNEFPIVLIRCEGEFQKCMGREELESFHGSVDKFEAALRQKIK